MEIDKRALEIIRKLDKSGYDAFVVGGCVRDSLMGKKPKDWDITTNAKTDEIMLVFKEYNIIPTGIQHGTVTIMVDNEGYEVTTYRVDGEYSDGRHPDQVVFTDSLKEDLSRRDFTINAMAYNEVEGIVDFFGGRKDIENKVIRCVGKAEERFEEDALRVLRALRFASVLGFKIEEKTSEAIFEKANKLNMISKERINVELVKILNGGGVLHILLNYKEVFSKVIPELKPMFGFEQNNKYHAYDVWGHTARVVDSCNSKNPMLRVAALFHDIGKPETYSEEDGVGHFYNHAKHSTEKAELIMKNLKFSTSEIELVTLLVKYHDVVFTPTKKFVLRMLNKIGEENFRLLMELRQADVEGQGNRVEEDDRLYRLKETLELLNNLELEEECFNLKHLAVNGGDLITIGYKQGKDIGNTLKELLNLVINGELVNEKQVLLEYVRSGVIG